MVAINGQLMLHYVINIGLSSKQEMGMYLG